MDRSLNSELQLTREQNMETQNGFRAEDAHPPPNDDLLLLLQRRQGKWPQRQKIDPLKEAFRGAQYTNPIVPYRLFKRNSLTC